MERVIYLSSRMLVTYGTSLCMSHTGCSALSLPPTTFLKTAFTWAGSIDILNPTPPLERPAGIPQLRVQQKNAILMGNFPEGYPHWGHFYPGNRAHSKYRR